MDLEDILYKNFHSSYDELKPQGQLESRTGFAEVPFDFRISGVDMTKYLAVKQLMGSKSTGISESQHVILRDHSQMAQDTIRMK